MVIETRLNRDTIHRSELARAVGTDLAHISKILSGSRTPSLHLAKQIANALHVSLDELYVFLYPAGKEPVRHARSKENLKTRENNNHTSGSTT